MTRKDSECLLKVHDLHAEIEGQTILNGVNLNINAGEIHAIMGRNGSGKSTLSKVIAGHPSYKVTKGEIFFKNQNILDLEPEERALLGIFLSFQYPVEIPGVSNLEFQLSSESFITSFNNFASTHNVHKVWVNFIK